MKRTLFLFLLWSFISYACASQLTLTRHAESKNTDTVVYTLPVSIGKQSFKIALNLSEVKPWIKSDKCSICASPNTCKQSCNSKVGTSKQGLRCQKGSCRKSENKHEDNGIEGEEVEISLKIDKNIVKNITVVEAQKILFQTSSFTRQYDGVLNLLGENPVLEEFGLIYRNGKLHLIVGEKLGSQYLDPKDQQIEQIIGEDGALNVKSILANGEQISAASKAYISLSTKSLLLPSSQIQSLSQRIAKIDQKCSLQSQKLKCEGSVPMSKIKDVVFGLELDNHTLEIPFSAFVESCKSRQCQLLIRQSEEDKIVLGEIVLQNFGVYFDLSHKSVAFHRMKNSFSAKYHQLIKNRPKSSSSASFNNDHEHQQEAPATILGFVWHFSTILFKIGVVIGMYYLVLHIYLNQKQVMAKIKGMFTNKQSQYSPAFGQEAENGGTLVVEGVEQAAKEFWQENTVEGI